MAWDDRWPVIHARRDFVVESTIAALRPTRLQGVRLKLQDTFVFTQPTSELMPAGSGFFCYYTDLVANRDRFPDLHRENQHTDLLPAPKARWTFASGLPRKVVPPASF